MIPIWSRPIAVFPFSSSIRIRFIRSHPPSRRAQQILQEFQRSWGGLCRFSSSLRKPYLVSIPFALPQCNIPFFKHPHPKYYGVRPLLTWCLLLRLCQVTMAQYASVQSYLHGNFTGTLAENSTPTAFNPSTNLPTSTPCENNSALFS